MNQSKIAIIGAGVVGSTTAYTLMMHNLASEILLVDTNDMKCKGEVFDLSDAVSFSSTSEVVMGTLKEAGQATIAIITAGIAQKPGQSRTDLLKINHEVIKTIIAGMKPLNPELIIIMVTNPVDILTYTAQTVSGLPKNQVFGSGTFLDTQRLRNLISRKINIAQQSIHLSILGEHGDSQCVAWSAGFVGGIPLLQFPGLDKKELEVMAESAKNKAYDIIECKGSTAYGVASALSAYCQNILFDTQRITPVSCYLKEFDVCMSLPVVLGKKGIEQILLPMVTEEEKKCLEKSAQTLKEHLLQLK